MSLKTKRRLPNPHPGEILTEEFLKPMALSQTALASATPLRCAATPCTKCCRKRN